jgi:hypothetical protein
MQPDDDYVEPPILTRIGWFFWTKWNRVVCATRGHDAPPAGICNRCGLPLPPYDLDPGQKHEPRGEHA